MSLVYHVLKMKLVTTTVSTAATVNNMYIYATMATANTTAESEMCGQQCSRKHLFDGDNKIQLKSRNITF